MTTTGRLGHARNPQCETGRDRRASSVASAVTYAVPVIRGIDLPALHADTTPSKTLPTMLSCRQTSPAAQLAVGGQARELRARAGAARRAVVRLAGAEDEVAAVVRGVARRAEQFDVVDLGAVRAGDALLLQGLPDPPGEVGQRFDAAQVELLAVVAARGRTSCRPRRRRP